MKKILVIEDEPIQLDLIADRLGMEFSNVDIHKVNKFSEVKTALAQTSYDVVVTDLMDGTVNRKDLIKEIIDTHTQSVIIVYTVAPESFPSEYVDHKRTFVLDKLQPFEEGMLDLVKAALQQGVNLVSHL